MRENHTYAFFLLILVGVVAGAGSIFGAAVFHVSGVSLWSPWHIGGQVLCLLTFAYLHGYVGYKYTCGCVAFRKILAHNPWDQKETKTFYVVKK